MLRDIGYAIFGYCLGSILFARVFVGLFKQSDCIRETADGNPGTSNAYAAGGFWCGTLTLICDLGKGFLPVFLYMQRAPGPLLFAVLAAPVIGHVFPLFYGFRGGKGIATTFGCLLGLAPNMTPVLILAFFFILFSGVLRISPHYYTTLITYPCAELAILVLTDHPEIILGFSLIFITVMLRMLTSKEMKKPLKVGFLWMH